jgi:excinuclease ABC subunit C
MLVALAKRQEVICVHGQSEPIRLSRRDPALRLLQSVRDEAHRFAQHYHHILRRRSTLQTDKPVHKRKGKTTQGTADE